MAHTRHYGLASIAAIEVGKGLAALCGQTEFTAGLETGQWFAVAMTVADFILARIRKIPSS